MDRGKAGHTKKEDSCLRRAARGYVMLRLGPPPPGSSRPSTHCSFDRTDIKRASTFRDDRHVLKEPAEGIQVVDQSNRRFWMQKIERIDPNIAIAYLF